MLHTGKVLFSSPTPTAEPKTISPFNRIEQLNKVDLESSTLECESFGIRADGLKEEIIDLGLRPVAEPEEKEHDSESRDKNAPTEPPDSNPEEEATEYSLGRMHSTLSITAGSAVGYGALAIEAGEPVSAVLGISTFWATFSKLHSLSDAKPINVDGEVGLSPSYSESFCRWSIPMIVFSGLGFKAFEETAHYMLPVQCGVALTCYGLYWLKSSRKS